MLSRELYKTDRNGTKYYHCTDRCGKCGGKGMIDYYIPVNGGVCFDCGGSGIIGWDDKEYTPEYEAKLEERRKKKEEKKRAEHEAKLPEIRQEWFRKNGFNSEGKTYLFLGNTYNMKERIKEVGGKFDRVLGWHIDQPNDEFQFLEISVEEVAIESWWDGYILAPEKCTDLKDRCEKVYKELNGIQEKISEYVGEVGDKIELELCYVHTTGWENYAYGGWLNHTSFTYLHTFKDGDGNVFIWKTGKCIEADYGTLIKFRATIKDHSEYKGVKQTVLTRCKEIV